MMKHHFLDRTENSVFTEGLNKGNGSLQTHFLFYYMWSTKQETRGWQFIGTGEGSKFKSVTWQGPIKTIKATELPLETHWCPKGQEDCEALTTFTKQKWGSHPYQRYKTYQRTTGSKEWAKLKVLNHPRFLW